jgi:hypothetical protein
MKVKIEGTAALERQLRAASADLLRESLPLVTDAAREAFALSQSNVPVKSGELRASGSAHPAELRHGTTAFARVEYTHPFAAQIHEGYFSSPTPVAAPPNFLRKAAKQQRKVFRSRLKAFLQSYVNSHFKEK